MLKARTNIGLSEKNKYEFMCVVEECVLSCIFHMHYQENDILNKLMTRCCNDLLI